MRNILWHLVGVVFFIIVFSACAAKVTGPSVTTEEEQRATAILQLKAQAWQKEQEIRFLHIAERLMAVVDSPKPLRFHLVAKPIGDIRPDDVNAWTDGSNVYVTRGLLRFLQNDDELAIIIAHEMAHAVRDHVSEKLARVIGGTILGGIIEGLTGIKDTANLAAQMFQLATLEFDREAEREADVYGLTYASRAGYDISTAVDLWERFAIEMPESYIATTHPSSPERFVRAEKIVAMLQSGSDPIEEFVQENTQSSPQKEETESDEVLWIPEEKHDPIFNLTPEQEKTIRKIVLGFFGAVVILIVIANEGDIIHLALVWDLNGIDGTNETLRIYWNGELVGSSDLTWDAGAPLLSAKVGQSDYSQESYIDNLKVWNYAKTDFSDRFVESPFAFAATVALVDQSPPLTWNYRLTHNDGDVTEWVYIGAQIIGASVEGEALAAGWSVGSKTDKHVWFTTTTPLTSNSLTGFHITGTQGGTGSWVAGSNWGSVGGPLPVELSYFNATVAESGIEVILKWHTATETNNLGFNIYRSEKKDGEYIKVNAQLIAGAGSDAMPHNYSFTDENVVLNKTYYYHIEDVDFTGKTSRSDIIEVTVGKQGIKTHLVPPTFALLQNYPNPFNPETWIPFNLAGDASVTISIYDTKGQKIKTITLGNRTAGIYTTKDRAAYWDGKDNLGEKVSSGVYYYTLQAGEFRATKKMVMLK